MNPMELYHNQVTRVQGPFSLRMFHRSWGLMLIRANLPVPVVLLDFPSLDRFVEELRTRRYDVVGIGAIPLNILKVRKMCELVREHQPWATMVVGGHVANIPDLAQRIDADHIVRGEGVRWFQRFLGEDDAQLNQQGQMRDESEYHPGDIHGQSIFSHRHPHITGGQETEFIARAFEVDFARNGPSLMRLVRTALAGWKRHKNHPDPRTRRHIDWEARSLSTTYAAAVWAAKRYYRRSPLMHARLTELLRDLYAEFGLKARLAAAVGGPYALWHLLRRKTASARLDVRAADVQRGEL